MRLLFASIHCYLDPSSGAALCTRELLELLAGRGMDCRVLSAGVLDHEREPSLDEVLAALELPARRFEAELGTGRAAGVIDLSVNGVRVTLMPTASSRAERSPESAVLLELAEHVFDRFRPDVLLTYGGHPACLAGGQGVITDIEGSFVCDRLGGVRPRVTQTLCPSLAAMHNYFALTALPVRVAHRTDKRGRSGRTNGDAASFRWRPRGRVEDGQTGTQRVSGGGLAEGLGSTEKWLRAK
jgi:hypothetical protein